MAQKMEKVVGLHSREGFRHVSPRPRTQRFRWCDPFGARGDL